MTTFLSPRILIRVALICSSAFVQAVTSSSTPWDNHTPSAVELYHRAEDGFEEANPMLANDLVPRYGVWSKSSDYLYLAPYHPQQAEAMANAQYDMSQVPIIHPSGANEEYELFQHGNHHQGSDFRFPAYHGASQTQRTDRELLPDEIETGFENAFDPARESTIDEEIIWNHNKALALQKFEELITAQGMKMSRRQAREVFQQGHNPKVVARLLSDNEHKVNLAFKALIKPYVMEDAEDMERNDQPRLSEWARSVGEDVLEDALLRICMLVGIDPISADCAKKRNKWKERVERNCDQVLYDAIKSKDEHDQKWGLKQLHRKKDRSDIIG